MLTNTFKFTTFVSAQFNSEWLRYAFGFYGTEQDGTTSCTNVDNSKIIILPLSLRIIYLKCTLNLTLTAILVAAIKLNTTSQNRSVDLKP